MTQPKNRKSVISPILQEIFLIIFLLNRFYPDVESIERKNMFLTDKLARKAFCVGGLFHLIKPLIPFFMKLFFFQELAVVIVYIIYFTIGIVANLLIICVLLLSPVKTASTFHILHLSIADSLLLATLPFNADSRLHLRTWRFGSFGCKVSYLVKKNLRQKIKKCIQPPFAYDVIN